MDIWITMCAVGALVLFVVLKRLDENVPMATGVQE